MRLHFKPMNEADARVAANWRYEPPYDRYNFDSADIEELVPFFADPGNAYYSISDDAGELIAFCCFGFEGRVPGGDYSRDALDLGLGVRPDLTGQGRGPAFVAALIDFAQRTFAPSTLRVTVAEFNGRALRVWERAGFTPVQRFPSRRDATPFVILIREEATA